MIRAVVIFDSRDREIFYTSYANYAINLSFTSNIVLSIKDLLARRFENIIVGKYSLGFLFEPDYTILVLADRSNKESEIYEVITMINNAISSIFSDGITEESFSNEEKRDQFEEKLEEIIKKIPIKITFVGSGGVGKTTMVRLLARGIISHEYQPTIFADVEHLDITIGAFSLSLFTVAGQEQYRRTWDVVSESTDIAILVLDSTPDNLREMREIIYPRIRQLAPYARYVAIANKQDLPNAIPPAIIEEQLGIPTYGMIAIHPEAREKLLSILERIISETP